MPEDHIANLTHSLTGYVNVGLTLYDSNFTKKLKWQQRYYSNCLPHQKPIKTKTYFQRL